MAKKVQQFKHYPEAYSYGQFVFEDSTVDEFQDVILSNGIPQPADKYNDKGLYSRVITDPNRDYIIQNQLRRIGTSFIQINEFRVDNRHSTSRVRDTFFQGLVFDSETFNCFNPSGTLKSYSQLRNALNNAGSTTAASRICVDQPNADFRLDKYASFFKWDAPRYDKGKGPGSFDFLKDQIIVDTFDNVEDPDPEAEPAGALVKLETPSFAHQDGNFLQNGISFAYPIGDTFPSNKLKQPFHPSDFNLSTTKKTQIFNEDRATNYLQFMFYLKGNKQVSKHGGKQSASNRIYVFRIHPKDLFTEGDNPIGRIREFDFQIGGNGVNYRQDSGQDLSSRWQVSTFRVTINTQGGASREDYEEQGIDLEIADKVESTKLIRNDFFDIDFANYSIYSENYTLTTAGSTSVWGANFTPVPYVVTKNTNINLQAYQLETYRKQIASAPGQVSVRLYTSNFTTENQVLDNVFTSYGGDSVPPYYKFCVVHWDDLENEINTIEDVFDLRPFDELSIIEAQENNTFKFVEIDSDLTHTYFEPGIKTIKILMFSYLETGVPGWSSDYSDYPPFDSIEPLRFKLVTARVFLDIPLNKYPDFGDFGGDAYTTVPWPFDTAVIGGLSQTSKYYNSINNTLFGGKIGNTDVIDEQFLLSAQQNIETNKIGESIEKMDLEQFRYFNRRYDMNTLLNISTNTLYNDFNYYDGSEQERTFSEESSVGQIFIGDNQDNDLKQSCKIELNTAELIGKTVYDSSGNSHKGLLIGDYKVKKIRKGEPMRRDSFIKVPKKTGNTEGAL